MPDGCAAGGRAVQRGSEAGDVDLERRGHQHPAAGLALLERATGEPGPRHGAAEGGVVEQGLLERVEDRGDPVAARFGGGVPGAAPDQAGDGVLLAGAAAEVGDGAGERDPVVVIDGRTDGEAFGADVAAGGWAVEHLVGAEPGGWGGRPARDEGVEHGRDGRHVRPPAGVCGRGARRRGWGWRTPARSGTGTRRRSRTGWGPARVAAGFPTNARR